MRMRLAGSCTRVTVLPQLREGLQAVRPPVVRTAAHQPQHMLHTPVAWTAYSMSVAHLFTRTQSHLAVLYPGYCATHLVGPVAQVNHVSVPRHLTQSHSPPDPAPLTVPPLSAPPGTAGPPASAARASSRRWLKKSTMESRLDTRSPSRGWPRSPTTTCCLQRDVPC